MCLLEQLGSNSVLLVEVPQPGPEQIVDSKTALSLLLNKRIFEELKAPKAQGK